jgi:hypothetical protein
MLKSIFAGGKIRQYFHNFAKTTLRLTLNQEEAAGIKPAAPGRRANWLKT